MSAYVVNYLPIEHQVMIWHSTPSRLTNHRLHRSATRLIAVQSSPPITGWSRPLRATCSARSSVRAVANAIRSRASRPSFRDRSSAAWAVRTSRCSTVQRSLRSLQRERQMQRDESSKQTVQIKSWECELSDLDRWEQQVHKDVADPTTIPRYV